MEIDFELPNIPPSVAGLFCDLIWDWMALSNREIKTIAVMSSGDGKFQHPSLMEQDKDSVKQFCFQKLVERSVVQYSQRNPERLHCSRCGSKEKLLLNRESIICKGCDEKHDKERKSFHSVASVATEFSKISVDKNSRRK